MQILHEINQLDMGGAEMVIKGIIQHDKVNKHIIYSYKEGPMRKIFESIGAEVLVDFEGDIDCDLIHLHTGGDISKLANIVKGQVATVETVHSPIVSAVRDQYVHQRVGVSNQVTNKNRNCITIYNGVDIERLDRDPIEMETFREKHNIPNDAFVIGRVGRLGYDKCVEEFLSAVWRFQKQISDDRPVYIVICGGEASNALGYLSKIKIMAASLPLKNVIFVPQTDEVAWVMDAFDVFLYPSPTESFGLVWFEAMACGIPVITWKQPLTEELLTGHAMLTEKSVKGLVEGLKLLYKSPDIATEFGYNGQQLVLSDFTAERMSLQYQDLYAKFIPHLSQKEESSVL